MAQCLPRFALLPPARCNTSLQCGIEFIAIWPQSAPYCTDCNEGIPKSPTRRAKGGLAPPFENPPRMARWGRGRAPKEANFFPTFEYFSQMAIHYCQSHSPSNMADTHIFPSHEKTTKSNAQQNGVPPDFGVMFQHESQPSGRHIFLPIDTSFVPTHSILQNSNPSIIYKVMVPRTCHTQPAAHTAHKTTSPSLYLRTLAQNFNMKAMPHSYNFSWAIQNSFFKIPPFLQNSNTTIIDNVTAPQTWPTHTFFFC